MKIAIIGTGISGMVTAHLLRGNNDIAVFEANDYIGGHTHTVDVPLGDRVYPVDTGFIVFNEVTYPNFLRLLKQLDVSWQPSQMSFSVSCDRTGLEYSPSTLNTLFAQRRNVLRPAFLRMVWEIFRFRRESRLLLETGDHELTLGNYLRNKGYSRAFRANFIVPMGAAIWSSDPDQFEAFPARYFVEFFTNHGFLKVREQPRWLVIRGGSKRYMEALTGPFRDRIRLNCPVRSVKREDDHVTVTPREGEPERFDQVVIATHSDQALALLADPSGKEREILGAIPYQENRTVLHTDTSFLPGRRACWASWNYSIPKEPAGRVTVTYNMNILQTLRAPVEFCLTLNPTKPFAPDTVLHELTYHHPVYTTDSLKAQARFREISGVRRTHFCGAYWGYGFHEDGVKSALAVCKFFGKSL
jgi:predicted NAD/FAD-binding protein